MSKNPPYSLCSDVCWCVRQFLFLKLTQSLIPLQYRPALFHRGVNFTYTEPILRCFLWPWLHRHDFNVKYTVGILLNENQMSPLTIIDQQQDVFISCHALRSLLWQTVGKPSCSGTASQPQLWKELCHPDTPGLHWTFDPLCLGDKCHCSIIP